MGSPSAETWVYFFYSLFLTNIWGFFRGVQCIYQSAGAGFHPPAVMCWELVGISMGKQSKLLRFWNFPDFFLGKKKNHISTLLWCFQLLEENPNRPLVPHPSKEEFGP